MMNAAAGIFLAARRKPKWTNPYVTDGLVAMWDAEWNGGGGLHVDGRVLTNLVTGESVSIPASGYEVGDNYIISNASSCFVLGNLSGKIRFPCTITSVGCCMSKPTNASNASGACSVVGIGTLFMWRRPLYDGCCGVVGGSVYQPDGRIHYYGAPSDISTARGEADGEVFGVVRSRAVVIQEPSDSGLTYYYNGSAKTGVNMMAYTDSWSSASYEVKTPLATSVKVKWCNISVYSRALTAAEIAANYAIDKERFNLPDAT